MALPFSSTGTIARKAWIIHQKLFPSNVNIVRHLISLPIEWKRPEKIDITNPFRSGDGVGKHEVDWNKSPTLVAQSNEMKTANEIVKKLLTFRFMGRTHAMKQARDDMIDLVKNHDYDETSLEVMVAKRTATIRNLMEHQANYPAVTGKPRKVDRKMKSVLHDAIWRRRRALCKLRLWDYKRYEWVLEKLDLYFTRYPEIHQRIRRKPCIRKLTDTYCDQFRQRKLDAYKDELEGRRTEFFTRKVENLKWMRQTEIECGVEPTVSEDEISHAEDQLKLHLQAFENKPSITSRSGSIDLSNA